MQINEQMIKKKTHYAVIPFGISMSQLNTNRIKSIVQKCTVRPTIWRLTRNVRRLHRIRRPVQRSDTVSKHIDRVVHQRGFGLWYNTKRPIDCIICIYEWRWKRIKIRYLLGRYNNITILGPGVSYFKYKIEFLVKNIY